MKIEELPLVGPGPGWDALCIFLTVMAESEITRLRGLQTLAEALRLEDFPMDHTEIDYAVGDIEIEDGRGGYVPVRDLTDQLRDRLFSSPEEVVRSLLLALRKRGTHAA